MAKRLFLIDAHSHIYRSFYAIRNLTGPKGQPTNAAYGFTAFLLRILREEDPDYIAVVFDEREPTFRHEQYADYKAQRQAMPEEMSSQISWIRQIIEGLGVKIVSKARYEADDVIATLATQASEKGVDVFIATSDKDVKQLLGAHTFVFTKDYEPYTAADLEREQGITPEEVVEMMALSGDTSDNVPGVRGVGPKTALQLIKQFHTLDEVYNRLSEVKGSKLQEKLRTHEEEARLSRQLVTLDTAVPLEEGIDDLVRKEPDRYRLAEVFTELGLKKFKAAVLGAKESATKGDASEEQQVPHPAEKFDTKAVAVDSAEKLETLLGHLKSVDAFAVDLETTSQNPQTADIVGISFSWQEGEGWYIPLRGPLGNNTMPYDATLKSLKPLLERSGKKKWGQNLKYDMQVLRRAGIELRGVAFDTMVASYVIDPLRRQHNLDGLSETYLGLSKIPTSDLIGKGKNQITMDLVEVGTVAQYACEDTDAVVRLVNMFEPKLKEVQGEELFRSVEMPLVSVLAEMEYTGIRVDPKVLSSMSDEISGEIEELAAEIHRDAGEEFNLASPKQLQKILFEKWKLKPLSATKTGYSTGAAVLEELALEDPRPAKIIHYRQLTKLKNTYIDTLPKLVNKETGRVHTSFNQAVTATGRLSSSNPNLQNIPIRTELGRKIRSAFVPGSSDCVLLTADYSQVELRLIAHLSQDPSLMQAFREDLDIHAFVASQVFEIPLADVTSEQRSVAKAVDFGIIYGLTPYGLSKQLGIPMTKAKEHIDSFFDRYSKVKQYTDEVIETARESGYATTLLGRRREIPNIRSRNENQRRFAERTAVNTVVQGTAADMIKVAMNRIFRRIQKEKRLSRLLLQIHDELVFEIPRNAVEDEQEMIRSEMANALPLDVAVKVDIGAGENWLDAAEKK